MTKKSLPHFFMIILLSFMVFLPSCIFPNSTEIPIDQKVNQTKNFFAVKSTQTEYNWKEYLGGVSKAENLNSSFSYTDFPISGDSYTYNPEDNKSFVITPSSYIKTSDNKLVYTGADLNLPAIEKNTTIPYPISYNGQTLH